MADAKRDKPAFEPPPWERDAFEKLARKRAEESERQRRVDQEDAEAARKWAEQARAAAAAASPAGATEPTAPGGERTSGTVAEGAAGSATTAVAGAGSPEGGSAPEAARPALDERQVKAMLVELAVTEPDLRRSVRPLGMWMAGVVGMIGIGMFGASIYFTVKAAGTALGIVGGLVVGVFGAFFIGVAWWMWLRATRGKGAE